MSTEADIYRKRFFAICNEARLSARDDRLMVASQLLGIDVTSLTDLTDRSIRDLSIAMSDWRTVDNARKATGAYTIDAIEHLLNLSLPTALADALRCWAQQLGLALIDHEPTEAAVEQERDLDAEGAWRTQTIT